MAPPTASPVRVAVLAAAFPVKSAAGTAAFPVRAAVLAGAFSVMSAAGTAAFPVRAAVLAGAFPVRAAAVDWDSRHLGGCFRIFPYIRQASFIMFGISDDAIMIVTHPYFT